MEKLLWIDLEMTGLDVRHERIIEVAAIVTDKNFKTLARYESVVFQEQKFLDAMDEWNTNQHGKSGLTAKVPTAPKEEVVEEALCSLVEEHFGDVKAVLCGNSIGQDRKFIDAYMPRLAQKLHYRMVDVTAWKLIMAQQFNVAYEKKEAHRALEDIEESIAELKHFVDFIKQGARVTS
jgi:oligoribonuclease